MKKKYRRPRRLKVGDRVRVPWSRDPQAVVEDCGDIGVGGRQIVRLSNDLQTYEMPAVELKLIRRKA